MGTATARRWLNRGLGVTLAMLGSVLYAPELMAFSYREQVGPTRIYSETPITEATRRAVASSRADLRRSDFNRTDLRRRVFLTTGGLRWRVLSLGAGSAFALTRPLGNAIVVNASAAADDRVRNGRAIAGVRRLSGVLAHETTHLLIRERFGVLAAARMPIWLVEGYCDHVAGESSLTDLQAKALLRTHSDHPALIYHQGRERVERMLAANGGSDERLFADAR